MEFEELRDLDAARKYVVEGLWLQRAVKPSAHTVQRVLNWAMEVASGGDPLPPVGFVADVGHIALALDPELRLRETLHVPGWPPGLGREYEDYVVGKLVNDGTFERASEALQDYPEEGKDRAKGLAYVVNQMRRHLNLPGVQLPFAVIRSLSNSPPAEVLDHAWEQLLRDGPTPMLVEFYRQLVKQFRGAAELLTEPDYEALEDRSALGDMRHYVSLRQIRQVAGLLQSRLPSRPVRPLVGRKEIPTRVLDEDQYPIGGYTSISTRGTIESLLHSQLAFMEPQSPDLFDMKFVRDELFYYSRDENQFLRRRRRFVFVLFPDLVAARIKDDNRLAYQRIVMIQAVVLTLVKKLEEWLSTDAIRFELWFVHEGEKGPLADEADLMKLLLREPINRGDAVIRSFPDRDAVEQGLNEASRAAQVHCLATATSPLDMDMDSVVVSELVVTGPQPQLWSGGDRYELDGEDAFDKWHDVVLQLLQLWV
jgi:hypothetical protein